MAAPTPFDAPVTTATLSFSLLMRNSFEGLSRALEARPSVVQESGTIEGRRKPATFSRSRHSLGRGDTRPRRAIRAKAASRRGLFRKAAGASNHSKIVTTRAKTSFRMLAGTVSTFFPPRAFKSSARG